MKSEGGKKKTLEHIECYGKHIDFGACIWVQALLFTNSPHSTLVSSFEMKNIIT